MRACARQAPFFARLPCTSDTHPLHPHRAHCGHAPAKRQYLPRGRLRRALPEYRQCSPDIPGSAGRRSSRPSQIHKLSYNSGYFYSFFQIKFRVLHLYTALYTSARPARNPPWSPLPTAFYATSLSLSLSGAPSAPHSPALSKRERERERELLRESARARAQRDRAHF